MNCFVLMLACLWPNKVKNVSLPNYGFILTVQWKPDIRKEDWILCTKANAIKLLILLRTIYCQLIEISWRSKKKYTQNSGSYFTCQTNQILTYISFHLKMTLFFCLSVAYILSIAWNNVLIFLCVLSETDSLYSIFDKTKDIGHMLEHMFLREGIIIVRCVSQNWYG